MKSAMTDLEMKLFSPSPSAMLVPCMPSTSPRHGGAMRRMGLRGERGSLITPLPDGERSSEGLSLSEG